MADELDDDGVSFSRNGEENNGFSPEISPNKAADLIRSGTSVKGSPNRRLIYAQERHTKLQSKIKQLKEKS